MARKIVWSFEATANKDEILEYWLKRNQSKVYPKKLNALFHQAAKLISKNPNVGRRTSEHDIRFKLIRDYFIFYRFSSTRVEILLIWDVRRDPNKIPFNPSLL